jgi:hypothetical protein
LSADSKQSIQPFKKLFYCHLRNYINTTFIAVLGSLTLMYSILHGTCLSRPVYSLFQSVNNNSIQLNINLKAIPLRTRGIKDRIIWILYTNVVAFP